MAGSESKSNPKLNSKYAQFNRKSDIFELTNQNFPASLVSRLLGKEIEDSVRVLYRS